MTGPRGACTRCVSPNPLSLFLSLSSSSSVLTTFRNSFNRPALPFPNVACTRNSHHDTRVAKLRLRLSNFSERNSCYKDQIYTDSHIAGQPEFCPPISLSLAGSAHAIRGLTNRPSPRSTIVCEPEASRVVFVLARACTPTTTEATRSCRHARACKALFTQLACIESCNHNRR